MSGFCALIDRRHSQLKEIESRDLFASYIRQVDNFSWPGATSSSVRRLPAVVISVIFGQSIVMLGCQQLQLGSTLWTCGKSQIGSLFVGLLKMAHWGQLITENFNIVFHPWGF